jgi:hypothetical protein
MRLAEFFSSSTRATPGARVAPFAVQSDSQFALYETVATYRLGDEAARSPRRC